MTPLESRLRQEAGALFPGAAPVIAAVSGGADSLALLHLLPAAGLVARERLLVAHFDHGLRPGAATEAGQVAAWAAALGIPCRVERWERGEGGENLMAAAREARHAFFARLAREVGAGAVATGHHRDDQVETLLDRLLRGGSLAALAGMAVSRELCPGVLLVRPLLGCSHAELVAWLRARGVAWIEDPSNQDPRFRRAWLRHQVLPGLARPEHPDPGATLALASRNLVQADDALEWMVDKLWPELDVQSYEGGISLHYQALAQLPGELACRCLVRCHARLTGNAPLPGGRGLAGFLLLLKSPRRRWRMRLRGVTVGREGERVLLHLCSGPARGAGLPPSA